MATIQERLRMTRPVTGIDSAGRPMTIECACSELEEEAATHIDALEKRVKELEGALKDIAGASWGWVAPDYEKGQPMTHKGLTIDRAMKALNIKICPVCNGTCEVQINHGHDSMTCGECAGSGFVSTLLNGGAKP